MRSLADIASRTADSRSLFADGGVTVAMVSGGADSVSLLRFLASRVLAPMSLSVMHVDHMLRGRESDADAAFVEALCETLGIPCRVVRYDVGAYALEAGLNLEDAGRRVRYRFADEELDARCAEAGVAPAKGRIATAHTLDDRAETLLMRLAQGSGVAGLVSPPYRRGRIVRPLLDCTRADVVAYLAGLEQDWREDATNADTTRLRARVRAEVVPLLREINPRFDSALSRTLTLLGDEDDLLDEMARGFVDEFSAVVDGEVRIERSRIATLTRAMMRRTVRAALFDAFPEASRLEFEHVEAICDGFADDAFARDLPDGLRAFVEYDRMMISRDVGAVEPLTPSMLTIPGVLALDDAGVISAEPGVPEDLEADPRTALIDADALRGPLSVDSPRPGDRMRPLGMEGTRKLQDILTDAKVPARRRARVPVVRDGDRIVWVAGVRMSDDYRITPETVRAVRLSLMTTDEDERERPDAS